MGSSRKAEPPRPIRPVEVDDPGCSYNPDREQHEEAVAHAVAVELQKKMNAEMRAKPPAKHVDLQPVTDPLLAYQVRQLDSLHAREYVYCKARHCLVFVAAAIMCCLSVDVASAGKVDEQEEESEEELEGTGLVSRRRPDKKTRTVRNKEARVKGQEAELAARQKLKQQAKSSLKMRLLTLRFNKYLHVQRTSMLLQH